MKGWLKAEYTFRPSQILRRLIYPLKRRNEFDDVSLPWGLSIRIRPSDAIGRGIALTGVYDLLATEALWRLIEPGDRLVDVGANIGYMTSIMAKRTGGHGEVWAIEPHPQIAKELQCNVDRIKQCGWCANITVLSTALSMYVGKGNLCCSEEFRNNRGVACLDGGGERDLNCREPDGSYKVEVTTMDALYSNVEIGVAKIDVEGREADVFVGARQLLGQHKIRDVLFEEHRPFEASSAVKILGKHGYAIFALRRSLFGPRLERAGIVRREKRQWEPPNLIATIDPERLIQKMARSGWQCLA